MRTIVKAALKMPFYQSFRKVGCPKVLPMNYTFLISTACNSRCLTCNIWKQEHDDLKIDEWKKIFKGLGNSPFWVTISGGEPFLQNHLPEMVTIIDKICQPAIINIPTNSLLPEEIERQVEKMLKKIKTPRLVINLSLDGVGEEHDRIRGVPGNFKKVMKNYENLKRIQERYSNLVVGFGTIVSTQNADKVKEVFDLVFDLELDQYVVEIAEERVELDTIGLPITPSRKEYSKAIDYLFQKMKKHSFSNIGRISQAFRFQYYQFVKDWLAKKKLLPDYAGFASCEIASWGEVWPSCIRGEKMGDLRDVDYDFKKVWFSEKAKGVRKNIKEKGTSYPLANAFYTNALFHPPTLMKVLKGVILK